MKQFKKALLGTAMAFALSSAQASPITVGGVTWDPDSPLDFSSFSIAIRQFVDGTSGIVSGFGIISTMNGTGQAAFCQGCELTFQFGNFVPVSAGALPTTAGQVIGYTGGFVNVFVDQSPELTNPSNPLTLTSLNTGDGNLWLSLAGHNILGISLSGTVQGNGAQLTGLSGVGQLDVIGGLAAGNFDTNTRIDGSDFSFSNSFTLFFPANNPNDAAGTGNFFSSSVPEPGSLALVGLGLFGAGVLRRRNQA